MLPTHVGGMDKLLRKKGGATNQFKEFFKKHLTMNIEYGNM